MFCHALYGPDLTNVCVSFGTLPVYILCNKESVTKVQHIAVSCLVSFSLLQYHAAVVCKVVYCMEVRTDL